MAGITSNRTVLIAIGAIIIIIILAAGYFLFAGGQQEQPAEQPAAEQPAQRQEQPEEQPAMPEKPELTGDVRADIVNIAKYLEAQGVAEVKFKVHGAGDPNSIHRVYGIVEAAARLNEILEEEGLQLRITIEETIYSANQDEPAKVFLQSFPQRQEADIITTSYRWIATLAEEGYILDLTPFVEVYKKTELADYYQSLMEAVTYKGRVYGIPQDTEARPLYILKPVLECLGYDPWEVAAKVDSGEYTWYDIYRIAKEAVDSGCAEWGVIHRKGSAHPDLVQFYYAFGGSFTGEDPNKLYLDVDALYKWLAVEYALARAGVTPENMLEWDWAKQIHPTIVSARTAFDIGGIWYWTEWQTKAYYIDPQTGENRPLTAEEVESLFAYSLFPAGEPGMKPVTLSQPFAFMISVNAGKLNPKFEELKDVYQMIAFLLVVKANDPDLNAIHSIVSSHLPIREKSAQLLQDQEFIQKLASGNLDFIRDPEVRQAFADLAVKTAKEINIEFLSKVSYMLEYTNVPPLNPAYQPLAEFFKEAVDFVLKGQMTPEEATEYVLQQIRSDPELAEMIVIRGSIPQEWTFP